MNKTSLLTLLVAATLSATAVMAEDLDMSKQLNGLKVSSELMGAGDSGGMTTGGGTQLLRLTNRDTVTVVCVLQPGPAEASDSMSPPAVMEPGESASLRVDGKYTGAPLQAALQCKKK